MYERDWKRFLNEGLPAAEIAIAQVSQAMADHLGATSRAVFLRHDYAKKAVEKHNLSAAHFPAIFETIDYGAAYADKPLHVTFYYDFEGVLFQVTVKRAFETRRLYIATFYKQNLKEVARKTAKATLLRP